MKDPRTATILLNWNGWEDTIACIASLLSLEDQSCLIVVCDNASTDDSWKQIRAWCDADPGRGCELWQPGSGWSGTKRIALIQTGSNLGFAGGCNVGIRFALQQTNCAYLWLLNNDTEVSPDSLTQQVCRMQRDTSLGLLGSTVVFHDRPEVVQCFGGYGFNFWTARVRPFLFPLNPQQRPFSEEIEKRIRYVSGASTFVTRQFVEQVGLLNEQYFLYFEEIDWAVRGKAFRMSYCPDSLVFHKEGRSIGSSKSAMHRSKQSELWLTRNRILFMRTHFPARVPVTLFWVLLVAAIRGCTGKLAIAGVLVRGAWHGLRAPLKQLPKIAEWPTETLQAAAQSEENANAAALARRAR